MDKRRRLVLLLCKPALLCTGKRLSCDKRQDLLGKSDDDSAGKSQKPIGTLRRVMRLQRQADLHDAKAKQDQTYSSDKTEYEGGQIIDHLDRITVGKSCNSADGHRKDHSTVNCCQNAGLSLERLPLRIDSLQFNYLLVFFLIYANCSSRSSSERIS